MIRFLLSSPFRIIQCILLVLLVKVEVFAQAEILRKPLIQKGETLLSINGWADENGYMLLRFKYASNLCEFRLTHREQGEVATFKQDVLTYETFGFTSTDTEFTLYFRGFVKNKKGYYFLTFSKNGNRAPMLINWLDKAVQGGYIFSYSAYGKLYVLKSQKENFHLVEVMNYEKSRIISLSNAKELGTYRDFDKEYFQAIYPESRALSKEGGIYCFEDSVLLISNSSMALTRLIKLDYGSGAISSRDVSSPFEAFLSSRILNDRFYQLRVDDRAFGLGIYHYPSLKLLNEFNYQQGDEIAIKTSPLVNEDGKELEEKWRDDKKNEKIMNELLKGSPRLSVQRDSLTARFQINSLVTTTYGGPYHTTISETYNVHFNACIDHDRAPCTGSNVSTVYDLAIESYRHLHDENNSDKVKMIENGSYVYNIHYVKKPGAYFIEEFNK